MTLYKVEFKGSVLTGLVPKISRQRNVQVGTWVLLAAFRPTCKNHEHKIEQKDLKNLNFWQEKNHM